MSRIMTSTESKKKRKHHEVDNGGTLSSVKKKKTKVDKQTVETNDPDPDPDRHGATESNKKKKKVKKVKKHEKKKKDQKKAKEKAKEYLSRDTTSHITLDSKSYHKKFREKFIRDIKQAGADGDDSTNEDEYEELHQESYMKQNTVVGRKSGRWSKQETDILKKNLRRYKKMHGIQDIGKWCKTTDREEKKGFHKFLSKNINRPVFSIYRRLRRLFDDENYIGQWSHDMEQDLIRLHGIHGNNWLLIGENIGVSADLCRGHFRIMTRSNKGVWSRDEEACLLEVMQSYDIDCTAGDMCLPVGVSWDNISSKVKTRNSIQCREKWVKMLSWKLQGGIEHWDATDNIKLLEMLALDMETEDEEEIDWEGLVEEWESARTRYYLRQKWATLKRLVPNYQFKTYQECLDYLLRHHLRPLKTKCIKTQE